MRLPVDSFVKGSLLRGGVVFAAAGLLAGCAGNGVSSASAGTNSGVTANGPQADFPILVGPAYTVNGVTYTPSDTLNYDEVGFATTAEGALGVSGDHHTLPVPSYVEVTSLDTGRTILVRLERRGPMMSNHLIALSPAALAQLEAEDGLAVRVRRVNPPEPQRAMLRAGNMAPARMDTPMSLVAVLRRELPEDPDLKDAADAFDAVVIEDAVESAEAAADELEAAEAVGESADFPPLEPIEVAATPRTEQPPAADGPAFYVQAAAFSTEARAQASAQTLNGAVYPGARFFRVRTGPFATREEAAASLAKVRAAGYDDARILTGG